MADVGAMCGITDELCVCEDTVKSSQQVTISIDERRYGEEVTIVKEFDPGVVDLDQLASDLKSSVACGGWTYKESIELRGNHRDRIKDILAENRFEVL